MIPTTINPPTDNLWKFIAISGVVLSIVAIVLPATMIFQLLRDASAYNIELASIKGEIEHVRATSQPVSLELARSAGRLHGTREALQSTMNLIAWVGGAGIIFWIIGLLIAIYGFQKWRAHQRLSDEQHELQVQLLRLTLAKEQQERSGN